jgi:thiamine pyrophosphate-dependent acetolactate synthase large subunit-like protein
LIYGARYDRVMEAFGGKGFSVEDPKDIRGALDEAMNHRGPALVNIVLSQGSARKPQQFCWHSSATNVFRTQQWRRMPLVRLCWRGAG